MEEKQKTEHFCKTCTAGVTEAQLESGEALRREGEIYCRECFRKTFPNECEFHPGVKLSVQCFVCKRMCCENCAIEIQGRQVCARCKDWALDRIEKGLPLEPRADLPPAGDSLEVAGGLYARMQKASGWVRFMFFAGIVLVVGPWVLFFEVVRRIYGFVFIVQVLYVIFFLLWARYGPHRYYLKSILLNRQHVIGRPFIGAKTAISWDEVNKVEMRLKANDEKKRRLWIKAPGKKLRIDGGFKEFKKIAGAIREICEERGIEYLEK